MAKYLVNGNQHSFDMFDGEYLSEVVGTSKWDALLDLLDVPTDAEVQVYNSGRRNWRAYSDTTRLSSTSRVRFVVGGGDKGR